MAVSTRSPRPPEVALAPRPAPPDRRRAGSFDRIVVPLASDDPLALRCVEAAARLASGAAGLVLVFALEVPRELPLDALFPEEEAAARATLRSAAALAESYGVHVVQRLTHAYSAASAVLGLAREYGADLIVVGVPRRARRRRSVLDRTATSILQRATCRLLLVTSRDEHSPTPRPA
jgi:nucleotide-binding universal stress UspA family protein